MNRASQIGAEDGFADDGAVGVDDGWRLGRSGQPAVAVTQPATPTAQPAAAVVESYSVSFPEIVCVVGAVGVGGFGEEVPFPPVPLPPQADSKATKASGPIAPCERVRRLAAIDCRDVAGNVVMGSPIRPSDRSRYLS